MHSSVLRGVLREVTHDNPKTAVVKILKLLKGEEHIVFSSLKAHYLCESIFCSSAKTNEKVAIENLTGCVRRIAMVTMLELPDIEILNQRLMLWYEQEKQCNYHDYLKE